MTTHGYDAYFLEEIRNWEHVAVTSHNYVNYAFPLFVECFVCAS